MCTPSFVTTKNRFFVCASSSTSRSAAGPITSAATRGFSSTWNACTRDPAASAFSRRSTSIAAEASE